MTKEEADRFNGLSQEEKNQMVRKLAEETKGIYVTREVRGSDGIMYTAFDMVLD